MITCPICESKTIPKYKHKTFKTNINFCDKCNYHFETSNIGASPEFIFKQQFENSKNFGANKKRNNRYLDIISKLDKNYNINKILEIGTPKDFHFLKSINLKFKNKKLYSYDIIENNYPDYINFFKSKEKLLKENIDLLFCIHTLEHIPIDELIEFVNFCNKASKYYIFEVPCCESESRVMKSSTEPHYSFFSELSIKKIFKNKVYLNKNDKVIILSNINI